MNHSGQVTASTVDDLVVAVLGDGSRIVPALREVERWALEAEQAGRARLRRRREQYGDEAGGADPDGPLTWTLTWRDGQIVAGDSGIEATATGATEQVTIDTEAEMAGVAET